MAKVDSKGTTRRARGPKGQDLDDLQSLDFGRKNWTLLGAGLAAIVLGFVLLKTGDITLAPILLVAGYLVLIPWALVARPKADAAPGEDGIIR
ncbi:MAG: hypothetical protein IPK72_04905 [Candidatus Eisenbacteria bacterium]|nr:hypothetical protein [Candidatus Eisenbacteria bacterium]